MPVQNAVVSREYHDVATGDTSVLAVSVAYPETVDKTRLLMELGSAFVDIVDKLVGSAESETLFADLGFAGVVADDLLVYLLGGLSQEKDYFKSKKSDDNAHG